jgi:hypothetical protein
MSGWSGTRGVHGRDPSLEPLLEHRGLGET